MLNYIDAVTLKRMFIAGTAELESNKEWINELNVFPVPDGDTGTNMTLTLVSAAKELAATADSTDLNGVSRKIATGTLRGARGNSGVIMSQLCRGFVKEVENDETIDARRLALAFDRAVNTAYKAVMKPKEGTILTVAKGMASKTSELAQAGVPLENLMHEVIIYGEYVLSRTPEMLPVLAEAGVVDSGGQGLIVFLKGAYNAFMGKTVDTTVIESGNISTGRIKSGIDTSHIETSDIKFGYCTEFIIMTEREFTEKDEEEMKEYLSSLGDSLVLVAMDNIVKVHVHTNHPGLAFEKGLTYGSLTSMKVDNMREEHHEKVIMESDRRMAEEKEKHSHEHAETAHAAPTKEYGFITVCAGDGMAEVYKGMSVDEIIHGGQTMNPSTEDFIAAIDKINGKNIFILPNNGNVVMAARQAAQIYEGKKVHVIPSKTVAQGITALFNFDPSVTLEDNVQNMTDSLSTVKTGEITYAIRDTEINGKTIHKGDYMGIGDGEILAAGTDLHSVIMETVASMADDDTELITIYPGEDADDEETERISSELEERMGDETDIEVISGGQPVYYYIISVE